MDYISKDIITRASKGDMDAFEIIYRNASGFVYNIALIMTGSYDMAAEITQDIFIKLFTELKKFRFDSSFKTWIYRITINTALNTKRNNSKYTDTVDIDSIVNANSDKTSVEDEIQKKYEKKEFEKLLNMLNPNQRACIVLRNIEGMSYKEIAETLKTNINTVRTWLKRARETLLKYSDKEVVADEV